MAYLADFSRILEEAEAALRVDQVPDQARDLRPYTGLTFRFASVLLLFTHADSNSDSRHPR
jgi:hypothetical protein